ncbi:MAG: winged helix-turn-helix transcriptional regulator [Chloroflexi bacterium]|nr:winged helix-turn-helix transcriptional regulator [Chloroflexota bacterium]
MTEHSTTLSIIDESTLQALSAITDRTRLQILLLLGQECRMCVGDIASHFRISRPAISHHLKVLKINGLVQNEKVGQAIYYWVNAGNMVAILRGLADALEECCSPTDEST